MMLLMLFIDRFELVSVCLSGLSEFFIRFLIKDLSFVCVSLIVKCLGFVVLVVM